MTTIEYTTSYPERELDLTCFSLDYSFFPVEKPTYNDKVRNRSELYLPTIYYPAVDPTIQSWSKTLGDKTFVKFLELQTLINHKDGWKPMGRIDLSLEATMKVLDMPKTSFYRHVIHKLWDYGLIDLVESDFEKHGTKALNLIVYSYPLGDPTLAKQPLRKLRDYKTDYNSKSKQYGEKGALVRTILKQVDLDKLAANDASLYEVVPVIDEPAELEELVESIQINEQQPSQLAANNPISESGFAMPDSMVPILKPNYSTTNIINRTEDIRYLTINKLNNLNVFLLQKSIDSITENKLIKLNKSFLTDFVRYLENRGFSMEFITDIFDILDNLCRTEEKLIRYIDTIKFDLERGLEIIYPRIYVRKIYDSDKFLN